MDLFQILDSCNGLGPIIAFIKGLFNVIKIVVPIILLIMGAIDLAKAVLASDDKEIKAATSKLTKRAIAAVAIFFSVTIVEVIMSLVGGEGSAWSKCWNGDGDDATVTTTTDGV